MALLGALEASSAFKMLDANGAISVCVNIDVLSTSQVCALPPT